MKKRDALDLLSDLKIKVHADSVKQISFVDVFKALIKRVFIDKKIDYKLSPNLSKKIKTNWGKKHKVSNKEKMKYNAQQQQAGLIIVRWARKMLNGPKDQFKKTNDKKPNPAKKHFPNDKDYISAYVFAGVLTRFTRSALASGGKLAKFDQVRGFAPAPHQGASPLDPRASERLGPIDLKTRK